MEDDFFANLSTLRAQRPQPQPPRLQRQECAHLESSTARQAAAVNFDDVESDEAIFAMMDLAPRPGLSSQQDVVPSPLSASPPPWQAAPGPPGGAPPRPIVRAPRDAPSPKRARADNGRDAPAAPSGGTPRRFPGPAGLLPLLPSGAAPPGGAATEVLARWGQQRQVAMGAKDAAMAFGPPAELADDVELFQQPAWQCVQALLQRSRAVTLTPIAAVLGEQALVKVPLMAVVIKELAFSDGSASALLADPSGQVRGALHKQICAQYDDETLTVGAVLVLRKVAIFRPSSRVQFLNITALNSFVPARFLDHTLGLMEVEVVFIKTDVVFACAICKEPLLPPSPPPAAAVPQLVVVAAVSAQATPRRLPVTHHVSHTPQSNSQPSSQPSSQPHEPSLTLQERKQQQLQKRQLWQQRFQEQEQQQQDKATTATHPPAPAPLAPRGPAAMPIASTLQEAAKAAGLDQDELIAAIFEDDDDLAI